MWNLQTSRSRKATIVASFACRLLLIIAIAFRLATFDRVGLASNPSLEEAQFIVWSQAELNYAIISATIPSLLQFMKNLNTVFGGLSDQEQLTYGSHGRSNGLFPLSHLRWGTNTRASNIAGQTWEDVCLNKSAAKTNAKTSSDTSKQSVGSSHSQRMIIRKDVSYQLQLPLAITAQTRAHHPQADAKKTFIGSVDNGTTSSRFLIFDANGEPVAQHQIEFKQIYPHSGWHEHDPVELFSSVSECIDKATEAFQKLGNQISDIKAIGITNQRETTVVWDKTTGEPLYNAVVWTDTRSASLVRELKLKEGANELAAICGEQLTTYPSVAKLLWLLRNVDAIKKAYEAGNLAFGTVDTWLVYKLNGGKEANVFVSDPSNAGRTMFMNISNFTYDKTLLDFFSLDTSKIALPRIVPSAHATAYGKLASTALKGVRITGCLGDQSAALVGQGGFSQGRAKNTYGTGAFLLLNVGTKPVISSHGLMSTVAFDFSAQGVPPAYALEGSIAVAGSSVKFLMNNLGFFRDSHKISELAHTVPDNGGTVFVTAFSGLFAPYWIDSAKGTLFGLTAHTQRGHIARATLEATCFQTRAILDAMQADSGVTLTDLAVDGGMSNSELCMQTQADIIQIPVDRPQMRETTALGAAIAAGFAVGVWKSLDELKNINQEGRTFFKPQMEKRRSEAMYRKWQKAVKMSEGWTDNDDEALRHEKR
ncbi:hypothetical protein DV736_g6385, partial [Chaetothyriales sp. CBS 134916]